jgi:hypothetical protein
VVVRLDVPPTGLQFLSAAGSNGFNCQSPNLNHQIICKGDLPGGGDTTITAQFIVVAGAPEDLVMTTKVDPGGLITETDEGNNEHVETTTVAGSACPGPPCVDLVAAQLVGSPDPYPNNGTVTMEFVLVNVGDTGTTLDPATDHGEPLLLFNVAGTHNAAQTTFTATPTNPGSPVTCVKPLLQPETNAALFLQCFGNLGPGEGVKVTVVFKDVTSPSVTGSATADPANKQVEFIEVGNNSIIKTVFKQ